MKLQQGSYVILKLSNKPELARCTFADGDTFKAVLEKEKEKDEKSPPVIQFQKQDIMAVLGKKPKAGSIYGVKVEPIVRRVAYKFWGDVRIHNWFEDHQLDMLQEGFANAYAVLKKLRVTGQFKVEVEIRQPQGKYAGMYKHRPKAETDILIIKPETHMEKLEYIIFHEYAHGIWYRMMTPKMRLRWIKLYHEYITLQEIKEKELKGLLGDVESTGTLRGFQREAEEDVKLQLKEVIKHIKSVHGLSINHLEMILENGESIEEYWPTNIEMSETEVCITDYARTSPEEFFAEAIAHKFSGIKLPKKVEEAYEKTMSRLVKGGVDTSEPEEEAPKKKKKKAKEDDKPSKSVKISYSGEGEKKAKKKKKRKEGLS